MKKHLFCQCRHFSYIRYSNISCGHINLKQTYVYLFIAIKSPIQNKKLELNINLIVPLGIQAINAKKERISKYIYNI